MAAKNPAMTCLFFLIYLFICFISEVACQTSPKDEEKQILLRIKREWGGEPALDSWNDTAAYCNWPGVGCAADGSVVNITLSGTTSEKISRPIPTSVCHLKNLSVLDLSFNNIPGNFPAALYACSGLRHLNLPQNRFVGAIPDDVHRLSPLLTQLDLSANNFSGDIPSAIGRLPAIRELLLNNNLFNGSFPPEIGNLSQLQLLTLAFNSFAPMRIPSEFGNLTRLKVLVMTNANLQGQIPSSFAKLLELEGLDLTGNSLTGAIPPGIWGLPNLRQLYLYDNNLSGSIVINGTIGAVGLVKIDLSSNRLSGSIPEEFGHLQNLSILFMHFNQLSGEIPTSISRLPALTDLRLYNNRLTGVIPPELGKHSPLGNLEIDDNMLSGELPDGLCDGGALTSIVVSNNKLTGKIPSSLGRCSLLDNFQIHLNQFSGEVPDGIWTAEYMTTLLMNDNGFSGTLPGRFPVNLSQVKVQNNRFTGKIPSSAGKLLVFVASNNSFSELPSSLTGLKNLQIFDLGGNLIAGRIPQDISVLKSLTELNLSHNQLTGTIPPGIGSLPVLTSLDLSTNQLSGSIPPDMGKLKLNYLNLSTNQLSGEIPMVLQSLAYDQSFLSNPGLCASNSKLHVAPCRSGSGSSGSSGISSGVRILFLLLGALVLLTALGFSAFLYVDYKKRRDGRDLDTWKLTSFQSLDFTESNILRGIREDNLIGSGGAGNVYKITVGNRADEIVAVKKISNSRKLDVRLEKQFLSEVEILGSIRHTNIVKLLCCISSADSKLLVYEYMKNGSLDKWLHPKRTSDDDMVIDLTQPNLDWPTRLEIAIGSAQGLCYMHHDCSPPIIHRDVKSSNILLDSRFNARIADFGLARMLVKSGELGAVSIVAGSFGYMAPECGYSSRLNEKVDVYSFGVVLLELTTGREASNGGGGEQGNLAEWAWRQLQEGAKLSDAIDPGLRGSPYVEDVRMVFKLGMMCTESLPSRRPSMKEVLHILLKCHRPLGVDRNPRAESDDMPLLLRTGGSRRQKPTDGDEDIDSRV
ncbi:hypothetical protein Cni_G19857 [Canna indica]|uniref:non-specific serine/threonine protein kinase n=1 Tax=Canna indica TaxID=4628 RepID=A0AAQ3KS56_9LILI|nr:hypothetical protein Cni_G19857 [Canna indica]